MTALVGRARNAAPWSEIQSGKPVRGATWRAFGDLNNWTTGRGAQLIPATFLPTKIVAGGGPYTLAVKALRRQPATDVMWCFMPVVDTSTAGGDCTVSGGFDAALPTTRIVAAPFDTQAPLPTMVRETFASRAAGVDTATLTITAGTGTMYLCVSAWEIPRTVIGIGGEDGVDTARLVANQPITLQEWNGFHDAVCDWTSSGRRNAFASILHPHLDNGAAYTTGVMKTVSATYVDMLKLGIPVIARYKNATTANVKVTCLAWTTANTGTLNVVAASGASFTATVSATTPTWTTATDIAVDAEDQTTADGTRRSGGDQIMVQGKQNVSGTLYLADVVVYES